MSHNWKRMLTLAALAPSALALPSRSSDYQGQALHMVSNNLVYGCGKVTLENEPVAIVVSVIHSLI